jgi:GTP pyrophosphokinase
MPDSIDQSAASALTRRFVDAVGYAVGLHLDQSRKGSGVPYAGHLLGVCSLVLEAGGSEDEAIAALLHDAGEDRGGEARLVEIRERFGGNVAGIVRACSDSLLQNKPDWKTRKEAYLEHLDEQPQSVLLVSLADKLFNARAILRDYRSVGESLWTRFSAGRDGVLWYYRSLSDSFTRIVSGNPMAGELAEVVTELSRLVAAASADSRLQARP